jgi:toxin ParE1/3/4
MKRYRLARPAKADLDEIWSRIAEETSLTIADHFVDGITEHFLLLAGMPDMGRSRNEIETGLRSFPVGEYIIYYRRRPRGGILISRVIHGRRDQARAWRS